MTRLITAVQAGTPEDLRTRAERALAAGAEMIELRLDGIEPVGQPLIEWAGTLPLGRWIATCRSIAEGGRSTTSAEQRASLVARITATGGGMADYEFADWQRSAQARETLTPLVVDSATGQGPRLILSHHDFNGRPAEPAELLAAIAAQPGVVPKLAWMPQSICDSMEALDIARSSPVPAIIVCMGEAGLLSRVLAKKAGAFGTYCSAETGCETAPGQASLTDMLDRYRWASIGPETRVFGVIGWPVAHSLSPLIHNAAFAEAGMDAIYLPLAVDGQDGVLEAFLDGCLARDWLNVGGFSVTIPHKSRALAYLGDRADAAARRIGAVNTLVVSEGHLRGLNTDCSGALDALTAGLGCGRENLRGMAVDVLGAGGAARAVVAGLCDCQCEVTIYNIIHDDATALADEFACRAVPWQERGASGGTLLANCTNVGMWPAVSESPYPVDAVGRYDTVFDVVYNPIQTQLLTDASAAGCRTVNGVEMFIRQAAAQFEVWTGQPPDLTQMRQRTIAAFSRGD